MEIMDTSPENLTIRLTYDEAMIVNNAMNEVCNSIHWSDNELHARIGATRDEVRALLSAMHGALPG